jgi:hypothetical protein
MDIKTIVKKFPCSSKSSAADFERWLIHIDSLLGETAPSDAFKNKEFLCKAFHLQKSSSISRASYHKFASYLQNLSYHFNIEIQIPSRNEVMASKETVIYFKDLEAIISFIDETGQKLCVDYDKKNDFLPIKSIVILGWHGLSFKEIAAVKKEDCFNGAGAYTLAGRKIKLDEWEHEILVRLSRAETNKAITPNGKMKVFQYGGNGAYLFRPLTSACEVVDETHLVRILKIFNDFPDNGGRIICFRNLKKNAAFCKIYQESLKSDAPLLDIIKHHLNWNGVTVYSYKNEYLSWKAIFHK